MATRSSSTAPERRRATPKALATHMQIEALRPAASRYDVAALNENADGQRVPGLQVRVHPSGVKTFNYRYALAGTTRRTALGTFPAVSLKLARERHLAAARLVAQGVDPQEHAAALRETQKLERARREAEITVDALIEEFIVDHLRANRRDPGQAERLLRVEVLPRWGRRRVHEITRRDAVMLVRAIAKRGAPVLANRVAALIVQLFTFAADVGHLETNPLAGLRRPTREAPRERKLDVEEIRTLWHALDARCSVQHGGTLARGLENRRGTRQAPQLTRPIALGLKLLLTTGQRRGELAKARWGDIDLEGGQWTIPPEHSKNGRAHVVPLSALALDLLTELRALAGESAYLFPTRLRERRGDAPMTEKALTRATARNQCGLAHWTAHDLRRTAASHMHRLGADPLVVERVLNHTLPGVLGVYNRHDYEREMRDALERWGAELRRIIAGESNIVALPRASAARA